LRSRIQNELYLNNLANWPMRLVHFFSVSDWFRGREASHERAARWQAARLRTVRARISPRDDLASTNNLRHAERRSLFLSAITKKYSKRERGRGPNKRRAGVTVLPNAIEARAGSGYEFSAINYRAERIIFLYSRGEAHIL